MASHRADGSPLRRPPEKVRGRRRADGPAVRRRTSAPTPSVAEQLGALPAGALPAGAVPRARSSAPEAASVPAPRSRRELREREERAAARRRAEARRARNGQLPQAGVAGVLGLATIVAPLAGDVMPNGGHTAEASQGGPAAAAVRPVAVTDFRVLPAVADATAEVPETLAAAVVDAPTAEELAAMRDAASRASRELERKALEQARLDAAVPGCDAAHIDIGAANGRLSTDDMCELWGTGHYLRADAAVALAKLSFAYREHFGTDLEITDSYRSYSSQVRLRYRKPGLAAVPGTSEHGWGLAVDLGGGVERADGHYQWLRENAPAFGWDNPDWARSGGSGPYEPWHWEFVAGQKG